MCCKRTWRSVTLMSLAGRRQRGTQLSGEPPSEKELQPSKREDVKSWSRNEGVGISTSNSHKLFSRLLSVVQSAEPVFRTRIGLISHLQIHRWSIHEDHLLNSQLGVTPSDSHDDDDFLSLGIGGLTFGGKCPFPLFLRFSKQATAQSFLPKLMEAVCVIWMSLNPQALGSTFLHSCPGVVYIQSFNSFHWFHVGAFHPTAFCTSRLAR